MRILIITNPVVGIRKEKRAVVERVKAHIEREGGTVDIAFMHDRGDGRAYASRAALEGYDAVYAAGGDGTVNEVASGMVGRVPPFGIIPLGTGNGMARSLGIPTDPDAIIKMLSGQKTRTIDTGIINGQTFLATAGIGFDAAIAAEFNRRRKTITSISQYIAIGVKFYFFTPSERITIKVDGRTITRKVFGLTFSNMPQYGGGAIITPQASPDSGKLVAALIPKLDPFRAIPAIKRLFDGTIDQANFMEYIPFTRLTVTRKESGLVQTDGETFDSGKNLSVKVQPASLKVYVP